MLSQESGRRAIIDVLPGETEEQAEQRARKQVEGSAALAAQAASYVDSDNESVREGWSISDLGELDWALSRVADLEQEKSENAAIVQQAIDRLKVRLERLNAQADRGLTFFQSRIQAYAEAHRAELLKGGKAKSRKLPHGTVAWKKVPAKATVADKDALLAWAKEQPVESGMVRFKEEAAWDRIKEHVETTGEDIPGVELKPEGETFTVKAEG